MSKTQRWDWAIGLKLDELNDQHLQAAYKLNWDNLCKSDGCRKNCKKVLCIGCFDRSWIDTESANNSFDSYDASNYDQKRTNLKTFVGLKNLGATCYVNCLLQLWFHNPALRKAIYKWKIAEDNTNDQSAESKQVADAGDNQLPQICDGKKQPQQTSDKNTISHSKRALEDVDGSLLTPSKKSNRNTPTQSESQTQNKIFLSDHGIKDPQNSPKSAANDKSPTTTKTSPKSITESSQELQSCQLPKEFVHNNPIQQLQLIFARLQFTNKKSIDPFDFIESLALNAAEQQDAQEFGNLFMEFLERSFSGQSDSFVSKIIQDQFCGRYSYATICDNCRHSSLSDSKFYELDLSIQNLETLHDCLNEYFRPVVLDGKYNCGHCQRAQSAHRKIILKSLPPTLNLQLLRFVYDVQRNVRQKLNSHIVFPEVLDMEPYLNNNNIDNNNIISNTNGKSNSYIGSQNSITRQQYQQQQLNNNKSNIYFLSAVLIHRGSSPHSGHYIAHIKDRISKDWYKFNDDSVERIGPQLQVSTDGENIQIVEDKTEVVKIADVVTGRVTRLESRSLKSKTAYMLVYQAQDNEALTYPSDNSEKWQLPEHLQTAVAEENSKSDELFENIQLTRQLDLQIMDARKNQIRTIYSKLVCRDPSEKFEFISKKWLQNWLTNSSTSAKFPPIDNSDLLCHHEKLDFRKIDQVKCVRSEGADDLYREYGGGPRLIDAMCKQCVELEIKLIQLKEKMKEDQKFITSQAKFKLDAPYDFNDAYIVGKNSYRDWQGLVMAQFKKSHPELLKRKAGDKSNGSESNNHNGDSDDDDGLKKETNHATNNSKENQEPKTSIITNNQHHNQDVSSDSESDDEAMEKFVFNSDILCEHNQLVNDTHAWRIVPKEVWQIFENYFDNIPGRPLIKRNANTLMCAECKRQEVEQQEIGDIQKQKASEQKAKLPDLFHNRKRASWCSMIPGDVYYALNRQFLTKWQKFIRNPCNQEKPIEIVHGGKLICEHGKSIYDHSNSNPVYPECPFVLISEEELTILKGFYPIDHEIRFSIDPALIGDKIRVHLASQQKQTSTSGNGVKQKQSQQQYSPPDGHPKSTTTKQEQISKLDDSDNDIYITNIIKDEGRMADPEGCIMRSIQTAPKTGFSNENEQRDNKISVIDSSSCHLNKSSMKTEKLGDEELDLTDIDWTDCVISEPQFCSDCHEMMKQHELKKLLNYETATIYITNNQANSNANTTINHNRNRRNRNRQQAYNIKPNQTLLELKKEIFSRCQVLPVDQRLFLDEILLDDNSKTMSELRIVPDCSLKLEVSNNLWHKQQIMIIIHISNK